MSLPPFHYARELRFQLKLSGPVDPWEVADRLQIKISEEPLDADGYLLQRNNNTRILISKKIEYEPRKRFTVAHEIGHFYIPHHQAEIFRCLPKDLQSFRTNKKIENEANEFAAEFLLPYGEDGIPEEWREKIAMRERIETLAEKIFALALQCS
ncbi:MAG: ImmA/IrrE family metallo-endopeptidase [Moorella sp. (in: firmicutes)]